MANDDAARDIWSDEAQAGSSEQRSSARVAVEVEVDLSSDSQFFAGLSGDISEGGLFARTCKPIALGSRVVLAMSLPTGDIITTGVVRWARPGADGTPPGLGIAFDRLPNSERASIEAFRMAGPPCRHAVDANQVTGSSI